VFGRAKVGPGLSSGIGPYIPLYFLARANKKFELSSRIDMDFTVTGDNY
jgi:hypothetical protein